MNDGGEEVERTFHPTRHWLRRKIAIAITGVVLLAGFLGGLDDVLDLFRHIDNYFGLSTYLAQPVPGVIASPAPPQESALDRVKRDKHLVVGYIPYYDMSSLHLETGRVEGFLPEVLFRIIPKLGIEPEDVEFREFTWQDFATCLRDGSCDLSIAGTFVTPERKCAVDFTRPLFFLGNGVLVRRGKLELKDPLRELNDPQYSLAVVQGEQGDEYVRQHLRKARHIRLDTPDLTLACVEVELGRAQAAFSDQYILARCHDRNPELVDILAANPYDVLPIAWAVRKGDDAWRNWLNERIVELQGEGKWWFDATARKWSIPFAPPERYKAPADRPCSAGEWGVVLQSIGAAVWMTLRLSGVAIAGGTLLGVALALVLASRRMTLWFRFVRTLTHGYVYVLLAIPALVLIVMLHYNGYVTLRSAVVTAAVALALNLSPFVAKIVAEAIAAIPKEQILAAEAAGYSSWRIAYQFKFKLTLRNSGEALLVQWITTVKLSSLASVIGVTEILHTTQQIIRQTYLTEIGYISMAVAYLSIVFPLAFAWDRIAARLRRTEEPS